ncbi:MAG: ABC transporter ATP-binding protein [Deltaproteobacteria bacterium]|nr:ABC transporter ATP-binding protein [Deltaproteobacteria bacterium]MBW2152267.1 ABC transporter ATP-binding protein [Deltaproteobacteria bacterium]
MPLLEIENIICRIEEKELLSGLTLSMERGEVHALLGPNGAGKSTLAYTIMGCEGCAVHAGKICFDHRVINALAIHERARLGITLAWQEPVRFEGISIRDYLTVKRPGIDPCDCLKRVGLAPEAFLHRMLDASLSGGERKRIELASVLALNPRLAILDEPDSGIDMLSAQDILNVIAEFRKNGASVLLITHKEQIVEIADNASLLCRGRIVCTGNPAKVVAYYQSKSGSVCEEEACLYV